MIPAAPPWSPSWPAPGSLSPMPETQGRKTENPDSFFHKGRKRDVVLMAGTRLIVANARDSR